VKERRFRYSYRYNSSKLHKRVGDTLRSGVFSGFKLFQEYPVNKVLDSYPSGRHKFDWVILDIGLVIECHGEQHYKPVSFGGREDTGAGQRFKEQVERDRIKKEAAEEAGFTYIAIPHWDYKIINENYIWDLYQQNKNVKVVEKPQKAPDDPWKEKQKIYAREYRQQAYQRQKEWIKKMKSQKEVDDESSSSGYSKRNTSSQQKKVAKEGQS